MKISRQTLVIDAPDLNVESTFWASLLGGTAVETDDDWHSIQVDGEKVMAIQLAPDHVRPQWPDGQPQQAHLDLLAPHLDAHQDHAVAVGAVPHDPAETREQTVERGWRVYLDPAGHPFCLCAPSEGWG